MAIEIQGRVGSTSASDGTKEIMRLGKGAEQMVSELMPRFYEQNYRGNIFTGGMTATSIANVTFNFASTTDATATPIIGLWNPLTNTKNLVVIRASVSAVITAATVTGPGSLVWVKAVGENAISTGITPINGKSLLAQGSNAKVYANTALTGKVNALVIYRGSSMAIGSSHAYSHVGTAVAPAPPNIGAMEQFDGDVIVPPGGVLALMGTVTPVAVTVSSGITWMEVDV